MKELRIGDRYIIHSYKHDGKIHKEWEEAILLDIKDDCLILANENVKVTAADGRTWRTKEATIMFFLKNHWYNITARIKKESSQYKCDIASPYVIEGNIIKYIDYDLDLKVFSDGAFKVLDRGEYNYHKTKMNYGNDIDIILKNELTTLIEIVKSKQFPFMYEDVEAYYKKYLEFKKETV